MSFRREVQKSFAKLRGYFGGRRRDGIRLAGYGAGGRGVMTLAVAAEPGDFAYVVDKNPMFHSFYTPGSHIPVCGPDRLLSDPVEEVVVFSFGYFAEIYEELVEVRARGTRLTSLLDLL
jgi:hypothetical protein